MVNLSISKSDPDLDVISAGTTTVLPHVWWKKLLTLNASNRT
jgi:hypothetical protein